MDVIFSFSVLIGRFIFFIDNLKANDKMINLIQDQMIHIGQVVVTWSFFILL